MADAVTAIGDHYEEKKVPWGVTSLLENVLV